MGRQCLGCGILRILRGITNKNSFPLRVLSIKFSLECFLSILEILSIKFPLKGLSIQFPLKYFFIYSPRIKDQTCGSSLTGTFKRVDVLQQKTQE